MKLLIYWEEIGSPKVPLAALNQWSLSDVCRDPGREIVFQNCTKKYLNRQRWQRVQIFLNNNDWESCSCHARRETWHISSKFRAYWDINVDPGEEHHYETWRQLLARRKHNSVCSRILLLSPILAEDEALTDFYFFPEYSAMFCKFLPDVKSSGN